MQYRRFLAAFSLSVAIAPAQAQWAVVDVQAIGQLTQQVQTMQQQVETAREQLMQAKQTLQTMTGNRAMERLLGNVTRNYLPATWPQLVGAMQGAGPVGLSSSIRNAMGGNAVLTTQQLTALPPAELQHTLEVRRLGALRQVLAQQALANVSDRFSALQLLIAAISTAGDQKAILDLQARIGAELGMLQNEQTKLQVLQQVIQAQDDVQRQQSTERLIAAHGGFAARFSPTP